MLSATKEKRVLTPSHKKRQKGAPRPMWGFRPTTAIEAFISAREAKGQERSAVIVKMLEISMHAMEELGMDWYELERLAAVESASRPGEDAKPGAVLARLAKSSMKVKR